MLMPPTTTVTIFRGTRIDASGDEIDDNGNAIAVNVPAIIAYKAKVTQDPATGTPRQITASECTLPKGTDVQDDDRLVDDQTGVVYEVTGVTLLPSIGVPADVWVALSQVGG